MFESYFDLSEDCQISYLFKSPFCCKKTVYSWGNIQMFTGEIPMSDDSSDVTGARCVYDPRLWQVYGSQEENHSGLSLFTIILPSALSGFWGLINKFSATMWPCGAKRLCVRSMNWHRLLTIEARDVPEVWSNMAGQFTYGCTIWRWCSHLTCWCSGGAFERLLEVSFSSPWASSCRQGFRLTLRAFQAITPPTEQDDGVSKRNSWLMITGMIPFPTCSTQVGTFQKTSR